MGIVFGITGAKEPAYALLQATPYEIRQYPAYFVAEVASSADNQAFNILAKYIGVFGVPQNEAQKKVAMTAPVVTEPQKIAMTAPVVNAEGKMQFVLPFEFTKESDVPKPTDKRVSIRQIPKKTVAVKRFNGGYDNERYHRSMAIDLLKSLSTDKYIDLSGKSAEEAVESGAIAWQTARYHPPFTLSYFQRNEIWIPVEEKKVRALIEEYDKKNQPAVSGDSSM